MEILRYLLVIVLAGVYITTRSRALALLCFIAVVVLMSACAKSPRVPIESFAATNCSFRDTGEWRTRRERGACISRMPTRVNHHGSETGGQCLVWSQHTIREKMQAVSCSKERWVRR